MTGTLNMKKLEAWINTVTRLVTYLLRCNTDVTSLLSGTAIKAVVAYITDYVTKPGLKTYSIFEVIRGVFDKNSIMLGGTMKRKEKARQLMIKIVNSLTSKMEIGGPMASLYLLGNPDHYTSHKFVTVYWKVYVNEIKSAWESTDLMKVDECPDKVVIAKTPKKYVGISPLYDYMYRPKVFEQKSMYEWVQMAVRIKKTTKGKKTSKLNKENNNINEGQSPKHDYNLRPPQKITGIGVETSYEDDIAYTSTSSHSSELYDDPEISDYELYPEKGHPYLKDHPLYETHVADFKAKNHNIVPNFVGGSLPRCDRGDREYYCMTMLTLFKPWRNGKDLKSEENTWDDTFSNHRFTLDQKQLMQNFNIRYECNDARDDYSTLLKRSNTSEGVFPQWMTVDILQNLDTNAGDEAYQMSNDGEFDDDGINQYSTPSPLTIRQQREMDAIANVIQ